MPLVTVGTLAIFFLIWAAMHDISHNESDTALEWAVLLFVIPAFVLLYRAANRCLPAKPRFLWLRGTAGLLLLFNLGAVRAMLHPKYAADPTLGLLFLMAGVPALGFIGYRLTQKSS